MSGVSELTVSGRRVGYGAHVMLDVEVYRWICKRLAELGHGGDREWAQGLEAPATSTEMALEHAWVVINSGMRNTVARGIMDRVAPLLVAGNPLAPAFGHKAKCAAMEFVWRERARLWADAIKLKDAALVEWCEGLPWIGPITKYHLAKNLGADVAKPDRWLQRLSDVGGESVHDLCARLSRETGDRIATVDVVLWRACAVGVLITDGKTTSLSMCRSVGDR